MNALDLLREGHRRLEDLSARYEALGPDAFLRKTSIREQLQRELIAHAEMEEKVFHVELRDAMGDEAWIDVRRAEESLLAARRAFDTLMEHPAEGNGGSEALRAFQGCLAVHAAHEEKGVFLPAKGLGRDLLEGVGKRMESAKAVLEPAA